MVSYAPTPARNGSAPKPFPIASALGYAANVHHWTKGNVDPFFDVLLTHRYSTSANQRASPCGRGINRSWESGNEIGKSHSEGRVFKAETRKVVYRGDIPDASAVLPAHSSGNVYLFLQRPIGDLRLCLFVRPSPRLRKIGNKSWVLDGRRVLG